MRAWDPSVSSSPVSVADSQLGLKELHGPIRDEKGAQYSKAACLCD